MNVISDLVGTVTTGWPVIGLIKWVRHHQSALRAHMYLGRHLPAYLLARRRLIDTQKLGQRLMVTALALIKNPTQERLEQMAAWSVEHELWPKRRQDVLERLRGHIADGARVYIASSVYEPTAQAFASRIGAIGIGTPLEIVDGRARFAEPIAAETHKAEKVLRQLDGDTVHTAYGDTWADIPLLERAAKPVAVYPDATLERTALERGWEILGDSSEA